MIFPVKVLFVSTASVAVPFLTKMVSIFISFLNLFPETVISGVGWVTPSSPIETAVLWRVLALRTLLERAVPHDERAAVRDVHQIARCSDIEIGDIVADQLSAQSPRLDVMPLLGVAEHAMLDVQQRELIDVDACGNRWDRICRYR